MKRSRLIILVTLSAVVVMGIARAVEIQDSPQLLALRSWLAKPEKKRKADAPVLQIPLSKDEAAAAIQMLGKDRCVHLAEERRREVEEKSFVVGNKTMRWLERTFGKEPSDGHSLWISLHGGGAVPQTVNDEQWLNQLRLYQPTEGIYVAPRAPTDTWNLWHEEHVDVMLNRLIENFVALRCVNPDKVYLMGYSAGGDGVWQLAPRMADRFAAAAIMAGHPNGASLDGLRNLPFAICMGADDGAYKRNKIAIQMAAELDTKEQADPGGYIHMSRIYEGTGHWMNGKDSEALPWMEKYKRNAWPKKIVWVQDDVICERFYWLQISDKTAVRQGQKIIAAIDGQDIRLDGEIPKGLTLRLADVLLDLDREVRITVNGNPAFTVKPVRTMRSILTSLEGRFDLTMVATAHVVLP